jgi:hypothetical protein
VYSENHAETLNSFREKSSKLLDVKAGSVCSYRWVLKDERRNNRWLDKKRKRGRINCVLPKYF